MIGVGHVILGQRSLAIVVNRLGTIIDIGALDARVAVLVLEGDVVHVDTAVNHAHNHTAAVITFRQVCRNSRLCITEHVANAGGLAGLVGSRLHHRGHFNPFHAGDAGDFFNAVNGDESRQ